MATDLLPLLACPACRAALDASSTQLTCTGCAASYPIVDRVPVFTPDGVDVDVRPDDHVSHQPSPEILGLFDDTPGPWLHLGAGATAEHYENSVELETAVFIHTDLVGDVGCLPFADNSLGGVLALNVFEHLSDPEGSARELHRVLRAGAPVLIQTAFLQPLHADPYHFYNATSWGVERWFKDFDVTSVGIPHNFNPVYAMSWMASDLLFSVGAEDDRAALEGLTLADLSAFWRDETSRRGKAWTAFQRLPMERQRVLAAGFELRAVRR